MKKVQNKIITIHMHIYYEEQQHKPSKLLLNQERFGLLGL